jgi:hypothetical protein
MKPTVPIITSESDEGFVDLVFAATDGKRISDGGFRVNAIGMHDDHTVGFGVVLGPIWERRKAGETLFVHWGTVWLVSLGESSDRFVASLDALYGVNSGVRQMAANKVVSGVALKGNPSNAPDEPVRIKLFFEDDREDRYGEVYINIDFGARRLEFHEKDEEFRSAVVLALSQDAG